MTDATTQIGLRHTNYSPYYNKDYRRREAANAVQFRKKEIKLCMYILSESSRSETQYDIISTTYPYKEIKIPAIPWHMARHHTAGNK